MSVERSLLLAILALQNNFITRDQLIAAFGRWVMDKERLLDEILVEDGALDKERQRLLQALAQMHLDRHGDDVQVSLIKLSATSSVLDSLLQIEDPEVQASLSPVKAAHLERVSSQGGDPYATISFQPTAGVTTSRFCILRPHARGGLGEVFVAKDTELPREVALKEILRNRADDPESRARFLLEAEITGSLEHPGIVPVYGLGTYGDGRPFYAMRFVRGDNLQKAIRDFHPRPTSVSEQVRPARKSRWDYVASVEFRQLIGRLVDVCQALQYAHDRSVLHRDLKPGNIMLGRYGETLVVDWGLAKIMNQPEFPSTSSEGPVKPQRGSGSTPTEQGAMVGTLEYMSPEQAAGNLAALGPAADIYSMGAVLYEILTGRPPFTRKDASVLEKIAQGNFPKPRQVQPGVPRPLEAICLKAMSCRQENRYASTQDLAADLENWLADKSVTAHRESWLDWGMRWVRKNRALTLSVVAATALVAAVSTSAAAWIYQQNGVIDKQRVEAVGLAKSEQAAKNQEKTQRTIAEKATKDAENERNAAIQARDKSLAVAHAVRSSLAQQEWNSSNVFLTAELLKQQQPSPADPVDRRGWEWWYQKRQTQAELQRITIPQTSVIDIAISPDGKLLAMACFDGSVRIVNVVDGTLLKKLDASRHSAATIAFSPDGKYLAAGGGDITFETYESWLTIWKTEDWSEYGKYTGHTNRVECLTFHPAGELIASGSRDKTVRLWNLHTRVTQRTITAVDLPGPASGVDDLAFSASGNELATCGSDPYVRIWDVATGKRTGELFGLPGSATSILWGPGDEWLAAGGQDGAVRVWDRSNGQLQQTFRGHTAAVTDLTFHEERVLSSSSHDGTIRQWNLETGGEHRTIRGHQGNVQGLALEPGGWRLFAGGDDGAAVWDAVNDVDRMERQQMSLSPQGRALFFSDGKRVAYSSGTGFVIWGWEGAASLDRPNAHIVPVASIALSADETMLAAAGYDGRAKVFNIATGKELHDFPADSLVVSGIAFSPDGQWLATCGLQDQELRLWNLRDSKLHKVLAKIEGGYYVTLVYHPTDGLLVAGSSQEEVHVYDVAAEKIVWTIPDQITTVHLSFPEKGELLMNAGADGHVRVWDWKERKLRFECQASGQGVTFSSGAAYAPKGPRLFVGTNREVRLFDPGTNLEVFKLPQNSTVQDVALSPDGNRLAVLMEDRIQILDARTLTPEQQTSRQTTSLFRWYARSPVKAEELKASLAAGRPAVPDIVRQQALVMLSVPADNPHRFNDAAWVIARRPKRDATEYQRALGYAREAVRIDPQSGAFLNTLGACLFRLGNYEEAKGALQKSKSQNAQWLSLLTVRYDPSDVAFLAMCEHKLGNVSEANKNLADARRSLEVSSWRARKEMRELVREAESLLATMEKTPDSKE